MASAMKQFIDALVQSWAQTDGDKLMEPTGDKCYICGKDLYPLDNIYPTQPPNFAHTRCFQERDTQ